ncbi:cilia- and flagella-associated protein 77-like [Leptodactylus fuscus]|uniref:cilia- and flagella-associated protein 77-like n=1 Tax=Leptodactylus fuscus TaxID=238119 RepID=UPI003F4E48B4
MRWSLRLDHNGDCSNVKYAVHESMNNNQLLQKAELGQIRRRCYSLLGPDFSYGQRSFLREGGVAEAISHWQSVEARAHQRKLESNFVALNWEAVKSGLVTAAEHQAFHNTLKIWRPVNEGGLKLRSLQLPQDITYSISTRPSTPIYDLIEHKYQRLWLEQQFGASEALCVMSKEKIRLRKVQDTCTSVLRRYQLADPIVFYL